MLVSGALPIEEQAAKALDKPKGSREDTKNTGKDVLAVEDLDHVNQAGRSTIGPFSGS
jgi:hypothetical protein